MSSCKKEMFWIPCGQGALFFIYKVCWFKSFTSRISPPQRKLRSLSHNVFFQNVLKLIKKKSSYKNKKEHTQRTPTKKVKKEEKSYISERQRLMSCVFLWVFCCHFWAYCVLWYLVSILLPILFLLIFVWSWLVIYVHEYA